MLYKKEMNKSTLDRLGMFTSLLCAVHCMAMPLLLGVSGIVGGMAWLFSPWVEWSIIAATTFLAFSSLVYSFIRYRHSYLPIVLGGLGLFILIAGHIVDHVFHIELHWVTAIAGIVIATAHFINFKKLRNSH